MIDGADDRLLDGLDGPARDEREDLLRFLAEQGFEPERIRDAHARGLLAFLPAERSVAGDERLTAAEVAERVGLDVDLVERLRRSAGLPVPPRDEPEYTPNDLVTAELSRDFLGLGLRPDQLEAVTRVLGRGLAQASEVMRSVVLELVLSPGTSERELAERYAAVVEVVMPRLPPLLDAMLRQHLDQMVAGEAADAGERSAGRLPGARDAAVCFADLVGFTRMGEEVPPDELGAVADRLSVLTAELVQPPVKIVKTIGDAVMLVSPDVERLLALGLDVIDAVDAEGADFPQVHVGVAYGPALNRGGDWYGSPVNVASRLSAAARAGSLLATEEARDRTKDALQWSFAGERRLKGLSAPMKLYRGRRL